MTTLLRGSLSPHIIVRIVSSIPGSTLPEGIKRAQNERWVKCYATRFLRGQLTAAQSLIRKWDGAGSAMCHGWPGVDFPETVGMLEREAVGAGSAP